MSRPIGILLTLTVAIGALALLAGSEWVSPFSLGSNDAWTVVWTFRLPRVLLVFCVGAVLALIGSVYQSILNNSLADPYILGTSSASAIGVVLAGVTFFPIDSLAARACGLLTTGALTAVLLAMANRERGGVTDRLILFGFAGNLVLSSLLFVVLSIHSQALGAGSMRWLFGRVPWMGLSESLGYCGVLLVLSLPLVARARAFNAISLGDGVCRSLGFDPRRTRATALIFSSILISIIVSIAGSIGFVGLIVPHLAREVMPSSLGRRALLVQFWMGGVFLVAADVVSRAIHPPLELPIGTVTNLFGGPLFLYLMWRRPVR
ncbi:MAG: iron ABC transporter permease [Deltaproteobacteria bacterium]|nr:iron ABC transporter permease [Deltaproteobacteria bacterium]